MPDLPTLTVTQAQADRLIAVFGDVAAYKAWLREALKGYVLAAEGDKSDLEYYSVTKKQKLDALKKELFPDPVATP